MEPYKHQSISEAYRSIYNKAVPKEQETLGAQYAEKSAAQKEERKKATLKVEASDLAYVLNSLIEDGTVTKERVKEIMSEKLETGPEFHARMKADRKPINQFPVNKNKPKAKPKVTPPKDLRTDAQKMADATGPRKGSNFRGD